MAGYRDEFAGVVLDALARPRRVGALVAESLADGLYLPAHRRSLDAFARKLGCRIRVTDLPPGYEVVADEHGADVRRAECDEDQVLLVACGIAKVLLVRAAMEHTAADLWRLALAVSSPRAWMWDLAQRTAVGPESVAVEAHLPMWAAMARMEHTGFRADC